MKKVEYFCNLCQCKKLKSEIKSLFWKSDIIPQRYVIDSDVTKSDNHICNDCIEIIKQSPIS